MLLARILLSLALVLNTYGITIFEDTNQSTGSLVEGSVTVNDGITWTILDNYYLSTTGELNIAGNWYVKNAPNEAAIFYTGAGNVYNSGEIVFDSRQATTPANYLITADHVQNTGKMWFAADGSRALPLMSITSGDLNNDGLMYFYQTERNGAMTDLGGGIATTFVNNGQVCLTNRIFDQTSKIGGNGCFDIGEESVLFLQNSLLDISSDQTFYLSTSTSSLKVESNAIEKTFKVAGWGNGNLIGFSMKIQSFDYNNKTGILTIKTGGPLLPFTYEFDIGSGYDESKMEIVDPDFGTGIINISEAGIVYNGDVPNPGTPLSCSPCSSIPDIPPTTTEYTTTFTTTNSDGAATTQTGDVIFSTDSDGDYSTTTSIFCEQCTEYTTTFTTTNSDGAATTQTGDVIITTDSDGDYTTSTSIISGDATGTGACEECTDTLLPSLPRILMVLQPLKLAM